MKKIAMIVAMLTVSASGFAASGDVIGTGNQNVTGSLNSSTCAVSFPSDVTLPNITTADYASASQYGLIGNASVSAGNISFNGCTGQNVKVVINSPNNKSSNGIMAFPTLNGSNQSVVGIALKEGISNKYVHVDGQESSNLMFTVDQDSFAIPVQVEALRASGSSMNSATSGTLSAQFTYTATYQ